MNRQQSRSQRCSEAAKEVEDRSNVRAEFVRGLGPAFEGHRQILAFQKDRPQGVCGSGDLTLPRVFGVWGARRKIGKLD